MTQPILILHVVWMDKYQGWEPEPKFYAGGFKYAAKFGWGHELFNFKPYNGKCYGTVQHARKEAPNRIALEKLGGASDDEYVDGVLVVWTAPQRNKQGRTIVGWFNNARVYALPQALPKKAGRIFKNENIPYRVEADAADCHLLSRDERVSVIPPRKKGKKGFPGQANVYYPQLQKYAIGGKIEQAVIDLVNGKAPKALSPPKRDGSKRGPVDVEKRKLVEKNSIDAVWAYFENDHGYEIEDLQDKNVGYDLRATKGDNVLCIEVKGRSIPNVDAEFSPNEYETIRKFERKKFDDGTYRICIVTNALKKPVIHNFDFVFPEKRGQEGYWFDADRDIKLKCEPRVAARYREKT